MKKKKLPKRRDPVAMAMHLSPAMKARVEPRAKIYSRKSKEILNELRSDQ